MSFHPLVDALLEDVESLHINDLQRLVDKIDEEFERRKDSQVSSFESLIPPHLLPKERLVHDLSKYQIIESEIAKGWPKRWAGVLDSLSFERVDIDVNGNLIIITSEDSVESYPLVDNCYIYHVEWGRAEISDYGGVWLIKGE